MIIMNRAIYVIFMSCVFAFGVLGWTKADGQITTASSGEAFKVHYELYGHMRMDSLLQKTKPGSHARPTPTLRTMDGFERVHIVNVGKTAVQRLRFKIYPNSYSSDATLLNDKLLANGDARLYYAKTDELGSIQGLQFELAGIPLKITDESGTEEIVSLQLPKPLNPGDTMTVQTPFLLKLPKRILDLGYEAGVSYLKNWYPQLMGSIVNMEDVHTVQVALQVPIESTCWQGESDFSEAVTLTEAERAPSETEQIFHLSLNMQQTVAVRTADTGAILKATAAVGTESPDQFFAKLLPGVLASKRPEHPSKLYEQMLAAREGAVLDKKEKPVAPAFLFNLRQADTKRYLSFSPALGFNNYDKLMAGVLVHNYGLAAPKVNFAVAPLYSTADKHLSGLARVSYTHRRLFSAWRLGLTASDYAINEYGGWLDENGNVTEKGRMRLLRIVPAFGYKWQPSEDHPTKSWILGAKAFILNKDNWVVDNNELVLAKNTTTIAELSIGLRDDRLLYPYDLSLKLQATDEFLKAGLTGNYFLGYDAKGSGLQIRGFAGKFFYLKGKDFNGQSNLSNYFFNLSGPSGLQDATYSDYFIGRAAYSGWMSQQMSTSEGFFKVSTPALSEPIGRTDDWLAAVNLTSDLPEGINPFAALPFRLPLRVFADFGTYSDLWSETPEAGRFLYDAGLQLSILKEAVTIYLPVLYSKIYRDTNNSIEEQKGFAHKIRFSINLETLLPRRLNKDYKF